MGKNITMNFSNNFKHLYVIKAQAMDVSKPRNHVFGQR